MSHTSRTIRRPAAKRSAASAMASACWPSPAWWAVARQRRRRLEPEGTIGARKLDHPQRAKRVIFLFMNGGALAGRQLRSEADARQVPRAAAARRHDRDRAQDRRADEVAVHVQEVRPVRHGRQRAVAARRRVRRRHLLDPLGVHRHPESRAVDADDEHRRTTRSAGRRWARG